MKQRITFGLQILTVLAVIVPAIIASCREINRPGAAEAAAPLESRLLRIANETPGTLGIAFVSAEDTVCVNNGVRFPMMSVFKLHEALAVAHTLEQNHTSLDTVLDVRDSEIDRDTWSPMLKEFDMPDFSVSVKTLLEYAVTSSDNNASNILFSRIVSPRQTEAYVRSIAPDTAFSIVWSEAEMKKDHDLAYDNHTSPLAAALLIRKVFEAPTTAGEYQTTLCDVLAHTSTGQDRLAAALPADAGVFLAHKTGSGYRNRRGELAAHNDVGYFRLPDGRSYALAVFIKDFRGSEAEASRIIAEVSRQVYSTMTP